MQLYIIGLGVERGDISVSALKIIKNCKNVALRTEKTVSAQTLKDEGVEYASLDYLYEKSKNFDTLTKNICKKIGELLKTGDVCYLVDGAVSEDASSKVLLKKYKNAIVYEGVSKVSYALSKAKLNGGKYTAVSAYDLKDFAKFSLPLLVYDLDSGILASEWKLKLMSLVGEEVKVRLYARNREFRIPMYEIDSLQNVYDYSTVLVVEDAPIKDKERFDYRDLVSIVKILRADDGCPWDRAQTKQSITKSLIEECYELVDAVNKNADDKICEETGDVLLQTAFYINFLEESLSYDYTDVVSAICRKLITRHSHVFGNDKAGDAEEALTVWNKNKQAEKGYESNAAYVDDVPKNFPAALRAEKVIKRADYCNFSYGDKTEIVKKIKNIVKNLSDAEIDKDALKELVFQVIALIRKCDFSAEEVISEKTREYISELSKTEKLISLHGEDMKNLTEKQVEEYRNEVKKS